MSTLNQFPTLYASYKPAQLKCLSTGWYVEYYVVNPLTRLMERKKFRLNNLRSRCRTITEFKVQANTIVCQLNVKLAQGWSPFAEYSEDNAANIPIEVMTERYLKDVEKDLRPETLRSYSSFCRMLNAWCDEKAPSMLLKDFTDVLAVRYMDEQRSARNWSNATYNNNLVNAQAFFTWCVKKKYIKENPFYGIQKKKKEHKKRELVRGDARTIIRNYFMQYNPNYLLICELVFQSLIRPAEIARLRVHHVNLEKKIITLPGEITKTKFDRNAVLNDELVEILRKSLAYANPNDFLVSRGYRPGAEALSTKMYRKTWAKMRKDCELPETMQLYSLRDTGIVSLFDNGADANTVKAAADHHNLNITSIYCDHVDEEVVAKVREHAPTF